MKKAITLLILIIMIFSISGCAQIEKGSVLDVGKWPESIRDVNGNLVWYFTSLDGDDLVIENGDYEEKCSVGFNNGIKLFPRGGGYHYSFNKWYYGNDVIYANGSAIRGNTEYNFGVWFSGQRLIFEKCDQYGWPEIVKMEDQTYSISYVDITKSQNPLLWQNADKFGGYTANEFKRILQAGVLVENYRKGEMK